MTEGSMRRRSRSAAAAAAALPDDDDLLREIFLRLPPLPSSLPRASLVSKRWLRLISDPGFLRRFRAFHCRHRKPPPLLGFFEEDFGRAFFTPTLDPPDRIPTARFYLPLPRDERWNFRGCRHGLALFVNHTRLEATVWDPVTGDQRRVAFPPGFSTQSNGVWGDLISAPIDAPLTLMRPSILVGSSVCWLLHGYGKSGILEFHLDRQSLAEISTPVGAHSSELQVLRMENSRLGLASLSDLSIKVWERKASSVSDATWMLQKTIQLDKLLSLRSPEERARAVIQGYDEDGHAIFICTTIGVFKIELKSLEFRNLFESNVLTTYHPYTSFYTTGKGDGIEDAEAKRGDAEAKTLNHA